MVLLFPLGKTGGLIEAGTCLAAALVRRTEFPLGKPAASLKLGRAGPSLRRYAAFPLGKTGGLIEA